MYRPAFNAMGLVTDEVYTSNVRANAAWVPAIAQGLPNETPLAVVGGGASALEHLDELREWPGHIWAINQTATWLAKEAPKAHVALFTVDPDPNNDLLGWLDGVERAVLGSCCNPSLFEALRGKDVQLFHNHAIDDFKPVVGGPSSATRSFHPALLMGYRSVTYYGCEGSFKGSTHVYRNESMPDQMIVRCGFKEYITTPVYYLASQYLAKIIGEFPDLLKEKSGGLLRGMMDWPDFWEVVALSGSLRDKLDPEATEPYVVAA